MTAVNRTCLCKGTFAKVTWALELSGFLQIMRCCLIMQSHWKEVRGTQQAISNSRWSLDLIQIAFECTSLCFHDDFGGLKNHNRRVDSAGLTTCKDLR